MSSYVAKIHTNTNIKIILLRLWISNVSIDSMILSRFEEMIESFKKLIKTIWIWPFFQNNRSSALIMSESIDCLAFALWKYFHGNYFIKYALWSDQSIYFDNVNVITVDAVSHCTSIRSHIIWLNEFNISNQSLASRFSDSSWYILYSDLWKFWKIPTKKNPPDDRKFCTYSHPIYWLSDHFDNRIMVN